MAFASSFDEADDLCLNAPPGMTPEQCTPLSVLRTKGAHGFPVVISCWKLTPAELEEVNRTGRIWLGVMGETMPPVWIDGTKPLEVRKAT